MPFQIKRVYEPPEPSDGTRVLVDRLWPPGLRKSKARLDHWLKDVAPTPELRKWFGHKPDKFAEFSRLYRQELKNNPALATLRGFGKGKKVTLLYAARDPKINHARVLLAVLGRKPRAKPKKKTPR